MIKGAALPMTWDPGAPTWLLMGSRYNAPVGTRELCIRMTHIFQSNLVYTTAARTAESEQFDDAVGCGFEGCIMVENLGLHWASEQEFHISCHTSHNFETDTCDYSAREAGRKICVS